MSRLPHEWGSAPDFVGPRHALREQLLLKLFLDGQPGSHVLNAGAGQGSFSRLLADRGFDVVSSDASPAAVRVLTRTVPGQVVVGDVTSLPFPEASLDAVILGEVLEHVDDVAALREAVRVLKPQGVVAASVPANPEHFGSSDEWAGHLRRYTRVDLIELIEQSGLRVERCVAWGFPVSTLYHRHIYERRLQRLGPAPARGWQRPLLALVGLALQIDRLFVGFERGALGYLVRARKSAEGT